MTTSGSRLEAWEKSKTLPNTLLLLLLALHKRSPFNQELSEYAEPLYR